MKLCQSSLSLLESCILKAISPYTTDGEQTIVTDLHLQPNSTTGELLVFDDDDQELSATTIPEWASYEGEEFYPNAERTLFTLLNNLKESNVFERLNIMKPFSFVLIDDEKETLAELLLIDDDTLLLNEELLKGLDEELDAFLKELLMC